MIIPNTMYVVHALLLFWFSVSLFSFFQAKIFYYTRERYYRSMKVAINEGLQKYSNDPLLKFLSAECAILQGINVNFL